MPRPFYAAMSSCRSSAGVSMVEYALVLALVVLPIIFAVNSSELRTALQAVFTGTTNMQDTSGALPIKGFGDYH